MSKQPARKRGRPSAIMERIRELAAEHVPRLGWQGFLDRVWDLLTPEERKALEREIARKDAAQRHREGG